MKMESSTHTARPPASFFDLKSKHILGPMTRRQDEQNFKSIRFTSEMLIARRHKLAPVRSAML